MRKRKLENDEQRLAAQTRRFRLKFLEIADQRLRLPSLNRENVGGSYTLGNNTAETALPGWASRIRTPVWRFKKNLKLHENSLPPGELISPRGVRRASGIGPRATIRPTQVRILSTQAASAVSVRHVRLEKIEATFPLLSEISARLCNPNFWMLGDSSDVLNARLCSPNSNFQVANPETGSDSAETGSIARFSKKETRNKPRGAFRPAGGATPAGSYIRRVAGTPHYDGVIASGTEPAVIAICGIAPVDVRLVDPQQPSWRRV
jgi:hypothetical protein